MTKHIPFLWMICWLLGGCLTAQANVRLSLLDHDAPRQQLRALLLKAGCSKETVEAFFNVVEVHNRAPRYDCARFGPSASGWYRFQDLGDLIQLMPYPFHETPVTSDSIEENTLPCTDITALLIRDQVSKSLDVSAWVAESRMIRGWMADRNGKLLLDTTPTTGKSLADRPGITYPLLGYTFLTGLPARSERETAIIIGLTAFRRTQRVQTWEPAEIKARVTEKLADLRHHGLLIDGPLQVVLLHFIRPEGVIGFEHAAILLNHEERVMLLEKNGSSGPFVLLDVANKEVAVDYLAKHYAKEFKIRSDLAATAMCISIGEEVLHVAGPNGKTASEQDASSN